MPRHFPMDSETLAAADRLIRQALDEDIRGGVDCTSQSVIPAAVEGAARFIARAPGVICGLAICCRILEIHQSSLRWESACEDGDEVAARQTVATLRGDAREMLLLERTCLNFLGRLSGIASLTRRFVNETRGTRARIHDTRKTTPGWRRLEKFAVLCGGGVNHRMGLYDAVLIKDNHLAMLRLLLPPGSDVVEAAVLRARNWIVAHADRLPHGTKTPIQIEVDRLEQLPSALALDPQMILLDNMTLFQLRSAVEMRDQAAPGIPLEASGGVSLDTVSAIARTGVDRISVGALTHSAPNFDIGMDWELGQKAG